MAEPSNIRVNPFTGTGGATNYVELAERHVIPAVSPYVIRLNEVPEKQDPSNMKIVYVDSATGAATETALTEVAATPGQGEFRPDYSTNALDDKTWNTGLIEFSASDAGKIVQVTYTGTGTLAGVSSNHWPSWYTDRGDGTAGDIVVTKNDKWEETQLSASCNNSQTTINVADNSKLNEGMILLIDSEKMLITALREGGIVSVTRGYIDTAKASHNNNAIVYVMGAKMTIDKLNAKSLYVGEESTLYTYGTPIFAQDSVVVKGTIDARGQCGFEANKSTGRGGFPNGGNGSTETSGRYRGDNGGTAYGGGSGGTAYNNGSTSDTGGNGLGGSGKVFGFNYVGTPDANLLTILNKQLYQYLCCGAGGGGGVNGAAYGEQGSGGGGGGCGMIIVANEITVTGKLTTKGGKSSIGHAYSGGSGSGTNGSGGPGGGGSILLIANTIVCEASNIDVSSGELAYPESAGTSEYAKGYSGLLWKVNLNAL